METLKIKLVFLSDKLGNAFEHFFSKEENVEIIKNDITKEKCDAIISPANSFGFMDGGLDYALSKRFGWGLQEKLQKEISILEEGELLIGKSLIIETEDQEIPYLISAPTMRIPMSFNISTSVNAYLAMKAILIGAKNHQEIKTIAIPGLCTGSGRMDPEIAANQMYKAYLEIEKGKKQNFKTFGEAQAYHQTINEKGMIYNF